MVRNTVLKKRTSKRDKEEVATQKQARKQIMDKINNGKVKNMNM